MSAPIDRAWLRDHPLPGFDGATDKNSRGQLLLVGGSPVSPAALLLTGEAALRAGCGKVQLATAAAMVPALAAAFPEAGMLALPVRECGEIGEEAAASLDKPVSRTDALLIGCGTSPCDDVSALTARLLAHPRDGLAVLLDAGACASAAPQAKPLAEHGGRVVLTPHPGEMAMLMDMTVEDVIRDGAAVAAEAARRFQAVIALRGGETWVASPDGTVLHYPGGGIGLATGGSGDVAAGVIGGLLARGADPLTAAAWGVWTHGEAGRRLGPPGFLARELLPLIPQVLLDGAA